MTPRHIAGASLAAAFLVAVATATVPALAAAAPGAVLTVSPAHPDASVASGTAYFAHTVAAGGRWTDEVSVVNTNDSSITAWVNAVDGITSIRTGAVYSARAVAAARAGTWVRPDVVSVTVAPHKQTTVIFTVNVPVGASAGDHLAGIAFESTQGSRSAGITTVLRSVVAIQVRVPGAAAFQLHLYGATLGPLSTTGTSGVTLDMEDVGGLLGKPRLEISIVGPAGYHRAVTVDLDTMLPGDRIIDEVLWADVLGAGSYRLSVTEDGSGRHGAAFVSTTVLPTAVQPSDQVTRPVAGAAPPVASKSFPAWVLFSGLAGGAGAAGLAILLVLSARHRRAGHAGMSR
ncbi:MAG: hypothetical protein QOI70_170 [Microbacteriaceae bacterium]|nr:hypothetical protein [Microbacteriaceae bacterium]